MPQKTHRVPIAPASQIGFFSTTDLRGVAGCGIVIRSGEAEAGSAGEQPAEEYPDRSVEVTPDAGRCGSSRLHRPVSFSQAVVGKVQPAVGGPHPTIPFIEF